MDAQESASKRAPSIRGSVGGSVGTFFLLPKQLLSIIKKLAKTELVINYQPGYNYCVKVVDK